MTGVNSKSTASCAVFLNISGLSEIVAWFGMRVPYFIWRVRAQGSVYRYPFTFPEIRFLTSLRAHICQEISVRPGTVCVNGGEPFLIAGKKTVLVWEKRKDVRHFFRTSLFSKENSGGGVWVSNLSFLKVPATPQAGIRPLPVDALSLLRASG